MIEVGKQYNERNLRYMRQFYELFSSINWNPLGSNLSWSHYRELLKLKNKEEILYYIKVSEKHSLSKRQRITKCRKKRKNAPEDINPSKQSIYVFG